MRCCKPLLSCVVNMNFKTNRFFLLCALLAAAGPLGAAGPQVHFSELLRPLELAQHVSTAMPQQRESKAVEPAPEMLQLSPQLLVESITQAQQQLLDENDSLELELKSELKAVEIPVGAEWRVLAVDRFAPDYRGRWSTAVELEVDGEVQQQWRLEFQAALYRPVYMTTQRLNKGEAPTKPAVQVAICNIYEERTRPVPAYVSLRGYEMVRTLGNGQFLSWDDVSRQPDIRKGDMVDVVLRQGSLLITMQAMSLQDGMIKESVRLRNTRSRVEFAGVIAAPGTVYVEN